MVTQFHGWPNAWGTILRTITGGSKRVACTTTFGHKIAAACDDDTVGIYDSVTGVLQLSLNPASPIQTICGSSGSMLFCAHKTPSITVWDIQTGGLIHTFVLDRNPEDIAVSLGGRYLACGFFDGSVEVWRVANKMEGATVWTSPSATHFCWLEPEEQLAVSTGALTRIWDVVAGTVLHSFTMLNQIRCLVYSRKFNRLAMVVTSNSGSYTTVAVINPQTGAGTTAYHTQQELTCFAFSQTAEELVFGEKTSGLRLFNIPKERWQTIEHPDTVTSISLLPNGTAAAHFAGSGVQLLSLDSRHAESQYPNTISALPLYSLDQGKIIVVLKTSRNCLVLLGVPGMSQLLEIPDQRTHVTPANRTRIFCASSDQRLAVRCFDESGKNHMELWKFRSKYPKWTVEIGGSPSIGGISPSGVRIVTFYDVDNQTCVCLWDAQKGELEAQLRIDPIHPLYITFDSDARFYSHHDTYRVPYDFIHPDRGVPIAPSSEPTTTTTTTTPQIVRGEPLPLIDGSQGMYEVDDTHEWVVSDSKRVCWIPPGYIRSVQPSHCWAGSSLFMAGQDGMLRRLTLKEQI